MPNNFLNGFLGDHFIREAKSSIRHQEWRWRTSLIINHKGLAEVSQPMLRSALIIFKLPIVFGAPSRIKAEASRLLFNFPPAREG